MWNDSRSLLLSKICVVLFMVLLVTCAILAPPLVAQVRSAYGMAYTVAPWMFLCTIYAGCIPAAALLVCLFVLLRRISIGRVFVRENTACLRYISWCCYVGSAVCLISAIYYIPWLAIGIAAAFMGLIVRVIKNVVAKAISLQDDADYTI